ncbi:hypothetical protein Purlil1_11676 [Purpureocillium lilacinum]|uniref:DUF7924 domain-containing protein n=1 Tax=Purpureocillium lilacinum TaxID=33203 RepID=A0ABR0BIZ5_PURLI|nr:hypothetical protein Purlil1_11676 [Purpureocillium lilacinum]
MGSGDTRQLWKASIPDQLEPGEVGCASDPAPYLSGAADATDAAPRNHAFLGQNVLFTELEPITNNTAVKPKPDFFDGASLQDLHQNLRGDQRLRSTIIPTKHPGVPVAPNFFCEAKGPDGSSAVAQRQACYDGAYGVRAMHTLQNYGESDRIYDGNACTFSSTYHDGLLKLYTHHVTAPSTVKGRPEYHMSQDSGPQDHDASLSFASSFTSFDTETLRSKRPRRLPSPTKSKRALPSTKGKGADTRQAT